MTNPVPSPTLIECPWSDLFGAHKVKLFEPIIDDSILVDPHCQHRCRVHVTGTAPPTLSKEP